MDGPVKVKVCGITRREDALCAVRLGADYLGLVFSESPRRVTLDKGRAILEGFPHSAAWVGVFRDEPLEKLKWIARTLNLRWVQLHGREGRDYVRALNQDFRVIKAFEMSEDSHLDRIEDCPAEGVLLDSPKDSEQGWDFEKAVRLASRKMVFLAGGLHPDTVGRIVRKVRPHAVDVSRGVEATAGIKDPGKMEAFIQAAKNADLSGDP